jgi:hypothetical protein
MYFRAARMEVDDEVARAAAALCADMKSEPPSLSLDPLENPAIIDEESLDETTESDPQTPTYTNLTTVAPHPNFVASSAKKTKSTKRKRDDKLKMKKRGEEHNKNKAKQDSTDSNEKDGSLSPRYNPSSFEVKVNVIPAYERRPPAEGTSRRQLLRDDRLSLRCEWSDCRHESAAPGAFLQHVAAHCGQATVRANPPPLEDTFLCLWADCGFETARAEEMVRHVNFHSFHTKVKGHGAALVAALGLPPCLLSPRQRNILPDLSLPWSCRWAGCPGPGPQGWTVPQVPPSPPQPAAPQEFYCHVGEHAGPGGGGAPAAGGLRPVECWWPGCSRTDSAVSKLREHLRSHSQEKQVACPTCGGLFASRAKLLDHRSRQSVGEVARPCSTCGKAFATARLLRDHMRSHVSQYQCPACDMTCATPSTLASHMRYRHTTERPHACQFCQYRGKTPADIRSHVRVHYAEAELHCPSCSFSCRAALTLSRHRAREHGAEGPAPAPPTAATCALRGCTRAASSPATWPPRTASPCRPATPGCSTAGTPPPGSAPSPPPGWRAKPSSPGSSPPPGGSRGTALCRWTYITMYCIYMMATGCQ